MYCNSRRSCAFPKGSLSDGAFSQNASPAHSVIDIVKNPTGDIDTSCDDEDDNVVVVAIRLRYNAAAISGVVAVQNMQNNY